MLMQLAWRIDARLHPVPVSADSYKNDTWIPLIHEILEHGVEVACPPFFEIPCFMLTVMPQNSPDP